MKETDLKGKTILVTGAAGFIGAALCGRLMDELDDIKLIGLDEMNDYYDPELKKLRLSGITGRAGDVPVTFADVSGLEKDFGFHPSTSLREGLRSFCEWYAGYSDRA